VLTWAGSCDASELRTVLGAITARFARSGSQLPADLQTPSWPAKATLEETRKADAAGNGIACARWPRGYREAEVAEVTGITKSTVRFHLDMCYINWMPRIARMHLALAAQSGSLPCRSLIHAPASSR